MGEGAQRADWRSFALPISRLAPQTASVLEVPLGNMRGIERLRKGWRAGAGNLWNSQSAVTPSQVLWLKLHCDVLGVRHLPSADQQRFTAVFQAVRTPDNLDIVVTPPPTLPCCVGIESRAMQYVRFPCVQPVGRGSTAQPHTQRPGPVAPRPRGPKPRGPEAQPCGGLLSGESPGFRLLRCLNPGILSDGRGPA